jgi:hypothetical protein
MNGRFRWTDKTVKEFARYYTKYQGLPGGQKKVVSIEEKLKMFKKNLRIEIEEDIEKPLLPGLDPKIKSATIYMGLVTDTTVTKKYTQKEMDKIVDNLPPLPKELVDKFKNKNNND